MDIIKEAFVEFMTTEQDIPMTDETNIYDWLEYMMSSINALDDVYTHYNSEETELMLFMHEKHCLSAQIDLEDNTFFCTLPQQQDDLDNFENKKETAELAMLLFLFMNIWEYEILPLKSSKDFTSIVIALSDTKVELSMDEVKCLEGILQRMAEDKGYIYSKIEAKNFELELRGLIEPLENEQSIDADSSEEESSEDEWI
jgi:hypothetical protein